MNRYINLAALLALLAPAFAQDDLVARLREALKPVATFDYTQNGRIIDELDGMVVEAAKEPGTRAVAEQQLLEALAQAKTPSAKALLCRQLRTAGSEKSVPALAALLTDAELAHMARYTLSRMRYDSASTALHDALNRTSGKVQAGIAGDLGERRYHKALPDLARLLAGRDTVVAGAAALSLGQLGGSDTSAALLAARGKCADSVRPRIDDALMACAEQYVADGRAEEAVRLYERFYSPDFPKHIRVGALRGLVVSGAPKAVSLLRDAMQDADPEFQSCAIGFVRMMKAGQDVSPFAELLPALSAQGQALLLQALSARGDAAACRVAVEATGSEHEPVRVAAYEALGRVGDVSCVRLLATAAATKEGREQQVARASLVAVKGKGIDEAIADGTGSGPSGERVELVRALAARGNTAFASTPWKLVGDADTDVRHNAIKALGRLVAKEDLGALVALAVNPKDPGDRPFAESAAADAFRRHQDPRAQMAAVRKALDGAGVEAKPALLRLMGRIATPEALAGVKEMMGDADAAVSDAALRVLSEWPDASPAEDLLALARSSAGEKHRILALRGYVRMAGLGKNPTAMYACAMKLAERAEDKRRVLAGLGTADSAEALAIVEQYLDDAALCEEAGLAAVQIAERLKGSDAARATAAFRNVLAKVKDARVRETAQEAINALTEFEGYILRWLASGPYAEKGKDGPALFDVTFPPEQKDARKVEWKPLKKGIGSWNIDLESAIERGDNCAAYMRTRVLSPRAQDARLELGSDDAIKAWLNGEFVHGKNGSRGLAPRQDIVRVKLREGWNDLMLKVVEHGGGWAFCCRVRGPDGTALEGLKIEAR